MRALIVDDNQMNLALLRQLIGKIEGCEALVYSDPRDALAVLPCLEIDVALIDYMMPGIDGVSFIRHLRQVPGLEDLPIVMVTTADQKQVRLEAIEAGATDFLTKPIEPVEFKARVRNLLALRAAQVTNAERSYELAREISLTTDPSLRRAAELLERLAVAVRRRDLVGVAAIFERLPPVDRPTLDAAESFDPAEVVTFLERWDGIVRRSEMTTAA